MDDIWLKELDDRTEMLISTIEAIGRFEKDYRERCGHPAYILLPPKVTRWWDEYIEAKKAEELAKRKEREEKIKFAMAKLSDEEIRLLGIKHTG